MSLPPLANIIRDDCCHCLRNTATTWHDLYGPLCEWCWNKYVGDEDQEAYG